MKQPSWLLGLSLASIGVVLATQPGWADGAFLPPGSQPGAVIQGNAPIWGPRRLPSPEETATPAPRPQPTIEGGQQQQTPASPDFQTPVSTPQSRQKVLIQRIQVEGATLIPPGDIRKIVAPYENRETTLAELQALAGKLSLLYERRGLLTSRVILPPQSVVNGTLTFRASENVVGQVNVEPGHYYKRRAIAPGVTLKPGQPLNVNELARDLRQINDNPDLKVRAILKPGQNAGQTDVELKAVEQRPYHLIPYYDNLGRSFIGTQRLGVTGVHNNLLGVRDRLVSSTSFTRRSFGVANQYDVPLGSHGTSIGFEQSYNHLRLGEQFKPLGIQGRALILTPRLSQQLYSSDRLRASADLAFDFINLRTDLREQPLYDDRLRVLRPALNLQQFDRTGQTIMRHELGLGLDLLGATSNGNRLASRSGAGSQFFRYTGSVTRFQRLPLNSYGLFRLTTQLSPDKLTSVEQIQAGGAFTVRGYREGQSLGDSGLLASAEWRLPCNFLPAQWKLPRTQLSLRDSIQLVTFIDSGATWLNQPSQGIRSNQYLLGVGGGVRVRLTDYLVARLDVGVPLIQSNLGNASARLHFGLQSELF